MKKNPKKRKLRGILSADVVGFSRLMEEDEDWTVKNLEENKSLLSELIEEYHGRVVDAPGDNILAEFRSVINAVECAINIQKELKEKNTGLPADQRMQFRIGVNLGDVIEEGGRIYGNGVNVAARLESLAEPGGVCISRTAYDQVKTALDSGYKYLGEHSVKNINELVRVYSVLMDSGDVGKVIGEKKFLGRISRRIAASLIIILLLTLAGSIVYICSDRLDETPVDNVKNTPKTLAVLPFEDYSSESDQEYFVLGLTEELINKLANISGLLVTARTSSFSFKDSELTATEIGEKLGVEYIIEGSVRKSGNALKVTAQFIRTSDGYHVWSETYDKEYIEEDIYLLQEDIANRVADSLNLTPEIGPPPKKYGGTDDYDAWRYYSKARILLYDRKEEAKESIEIATGLDPAYPDAWALKGLIHFMMASFFSNAEETPLEIKSALKAANHAIELKPGFGKAYLTLGTVHMMRGDFIEAERAYQKGIDLTDESIDYFDYGLTLHYNVVGRLKRCNEFLDAARKNDPYKETLYSTYILSMGFMGNKEGAEKEYKDGINMFGNDWNLGHEVITLLRLTYGNSLTIDDIVYSSKIFDSAKKHLDSPEKGLAELRKFYSEKDKLTEKDITDISIWAAYFGNPDFAMDALETGVKTNAMGLFKIWTPVMEKVRKLPRFKKLVKETGLLDYWNEFEWPDAYCRPLDDGDFECY